MGPGPALLALHHVGFTCTTCCISALTLTHAPLHLPPLQLFHLISGIFSLVLPGGPAPALRFTHSSHIRMVTTLTLFLLHTAFTHLSSHVTTRFTSTFLRLRLHHCTFYHTPLHFHLIILSFDYTNPPALELRLLPGYSSPACSYLRSRLTYRTTWTTFRTTVWVRPRFGPHSPAILSGPLHTCLHTGPFSQIFGAVWEVHHCCTDCSRCPHLPGFTSFHAAFSATWTPDHTAAQFYRSSFSRYTRLLLHCVFSAFRTATGIDSFPHAGFSPTTGRCAHLILPGISYSPRYAPRTHLPPLHARFVTDDDWIWTTLVGCVYTSPFSPTRFTVPLGILHSSLHCCTPACIHHLPLCTSHCDLLHCTIVSGSGSPDFIRFTFWTHTDLHTAPRTCTSVSLGLPLDCTVAPPLHHSFTVYAHVALHSPHHCLFRTPRAWDYLFSHLSSLGSSCTHRTSTYARTHSAPPSHFPGSAPLHSVYPPDHSPHTFTVLHHGTACTPSLHRHTWDHLPLHVHSRTSSRLG